MIARAESLFKREAVLVEQILGCDARDTFLWAQRAARQPVDDEELAASFEYALGLEGEVVAVFWLDLKKSVRQDRPVYQRLAQLCAADRIDYSPDDFDVANLSRYGI